MMQSFATFLDAAQNLTGSRKRDLMAKVAPDYLAGSARPAERYFAIFSCLTRSTRLQI
ncbi:hypothetical protein [Microcoleus sp. F10-C6]|uniref:hypothetical protein n=1 Tax=Microcoleus sp. F10-C6 TaxID=2818757 RepID=UPI002FCEFE5E